MPDSTLRGRVTYEDYCQFPDDGKRYEILDGKVYVTPAPSPRHQYASAQLQRVLEDYFHSRRKYLVFNAPLDVIFGGDEVLQPDLLVVDRTKVSGRGVEGAPFLIVEVLSPSHLALDRQLKAERYAVRGVPHFWLLDPIGLTLECYRLAADKYELVSSGRMQDHVEVDDFSGLVVPLGKLWLN